MSERKMREDGLGRDPDGSGLSQAEPSGLGPSDFDPSREAWPDFEPDEIVRRVRCLADDAPDEGDSPAQIWRHACDTILLRMGKHPSQDAASWPRRPMPGLSEQGYRMAYDVPWLRDWRARTGMTLQEAMAAHDKALRASDERPTGPRPSGLGADPASAIGKAEAPINSTMLSALKAMDEALTEAWGDPDSECVRLQLELGVDTLAAWIQIRSAISQANRG